MPSIAKSVTTFLPVSTLALTLLCGQPAASQTPPPTVPVTPPPTGDVTPPPNVGVTPAGAAYCLAWSDSALDIVQAFEEVAVQLDLTPPVLPRSIPPANARPELPLRTAATTAATPQMVLEALADALLRDPLAPTKVVTSAGQQLSCPSGVVLPAPGLPSPLVSVSHPSPSLAW